MSTNTKRQIDDDAEANEFADTALEVSPARLAVMTLLFLAVGWWIALRAVSTTEILRAGPAVSTAELDAKRSALAPVRERRVVLLFGDSVFGRTILDSRTNGRPGERSVTDALRAEIDPAAEVEIVDMTYDGLLPCDVAAMLDLLGDQIADRNVDVVYGLTPRVLSRDYREKASSYSRDLFRMIDDAAGRAILFDRPTLATPWLTDDGAGLARHRAGLGAARLSLPDIVRRPEAWTTPEPRRASSVDLSAAARVAPHFLAGDRTRTGSQWSALRDIADRLFETRSIVFLSPMNGEALGVSDDDDRLIAAEMEIVAAMRRRTPNGHGVDVRNFDDDEFGADLFVDHCHLTTAGNVRLARRIMRSLSIPARDYPPATLLSKDPDAAMTIVAGPGKGATNDGFGGRADVDAVDLAVVRPGVTWGIDRTGRVFEIVETTGAVTTVARIELTRPITDAPIDERPALILTGDGRGGIVVIEGDDVVHTIDNGRVSTVRFERSESEPRFRPVVAIGGDQGVLIVGGEPAHAYLLPSGASVRTDLGPIAGIERRIVAGSADNLGRIHIVDERGNILRSTPAIGSGVVTWSTETLFTNRSDRYAAVEADLKAVGGTSTTRLKDGETAFVSPTSIATARNGEWIFLSDVNRRSTDDPTTDDKRRSSTIWRLDPVSRSGVAILPPGRDGVARRSTTAEFLAEESKIVYDDARGRIIAAVSGLKSIVSIDERLTRRSSWIVGVPPLAVPSTRTFSGRTHTTPDSESLRIGVFGSSMTIGHHIDSRFKRNDVDDKVERPLVSARSLGVTFEESLRRRLGGGAVRIEVADYSVPLASIVRHYVAAAACDPRDIDEAIFCFDRTTFKDSVGSGPTLAEVWNRLDRAADGRPRFTLEAGFCPAPLLVDRSLASPVEAEAAIEACFFAVVDLAEANGWKLAFVDISSIDGDRASGIAPLDPQVEARKRVIEKAARRAGITYFDAGKILRERAGEGMPLSAEGDRHFSMFGLTALGDLLAERFAQRTAMELFRRRSDPDRMDRARAAKMTDARPRVALRAPTESELARFGVRMEECGRAESSNGWILTIDVTRDDPAPPAIRTAAAVVAALSGRLREGDEIVVHVVKYLRRNEYGLVDRDSTVPVASYRIAPNALGRLREFSERPKETSNAVGEWLTPTKTDER